MLKKTIKFLESCRLTQVILTISLFLLFVLFHHLNFSVLLPLNFLPAFHFLAPAILALFLGYLFNKLISLNKKLEVMAKTDHLSKLSNRQCFISQVENNIGLEEKKENFSSYIIFDIDFFKKINDTYGHGAGDKVIKYFSDLLKKNIRDTDFVARIGGEEFAVFLTNTSLKNAESVAEKIRSIVESSIVKVSKTKSVKFTISAGIFSGLNSDLSYNDFYTFADEALYKAKHSGRNKVCIYS